MTLQELDLNKVYTYADYLQWKLEEVVELIRGKIYKMSRAPLFDHQQLSANLFFQIKKLIDGQEACTIVSSPFDVRLPKRPHNITDEEIYTVVQPDLCIICDRTKIDRRGCIGPPDLVVEILSASTSVKDTTVKLSLYEEAGVREYWIASPLEKAIVAYDLNNKGKYDLRGVFQEHQMIQVAVLGNRGVPLSEAFKGLLGEEG